MTAADPQPLTPAMPLQDGPSLQEVHFPDLPCFGCGPANERGLRLRSYPVDGVVVARFTPWPEHNNGLGYLNGGIIATVLDCHSAAAVVHEAAERGWPALPGAPLPYVTAGLDLRYLRPSPLDRTVTLVAEITESGPDQIGTLVRLEWDGKTRAEATSLFRRWRPR
ncbi:MAG TPA: PaaI family thioesterase [Kineosporiaceae bacterium]|nr:PaaI family thioesterase [Kineosporiaceae bacterium]